MILGSIENRNKAADGVNALLKWLTSAPMGEI